MEYILDSEALQFIWSALREPVSPSNSQQAIKKSQNIVEKAWAFKADVEDLLYYLDSRFSLQFDVIEFSKMFGIQWEPVCFRPKAKSNCVYEYDAIRADDTALLLIILERISFQTDPIILVNLLLPSVKARNKKVMNGAELEIFWYIKTRQKTGKITLKTECVPIAVKKSDNFKTNGKYKIVVKGTDYNTPQLIEISSPKFRKRPEPQLIMCKQCGVRWYKGDPDSSASHRKEHKLRMYYLDPKPSIDMLRECDTVENPELVIISSPTWKHKEIYIRALAFKREFGYDFVQWQNKKGDNDPYVHGFLFLDQSKSIVGSCSFRRRDENGNGQNWTLDWVWICPQERRKGHLASRWKRLRERFGDFNLTLPVSDGMNAFLAKQGDAALVPGL